MKERENIELIARIDEANSIEPTLEEKDLRKLMKDYLVKTISKRCR